MTRLPLSAPVRESSNGDARIPPRLIVALVSGTMLTPLNSSMIAVALVRIQHDFDVGISTVTWLISAFYLAGAIGQPLSGRLGDHFGPRRLFCAGLCVTAVIAALAPWAPGIWWLVGARVVQALSLSPAFSTAMRLLRTQAGGGTPTRALGAVAMSSQASAALGPVVGGLLVVFGGWQAVFLVNLPLATLGLAAVLRWLPRDKPRPALTSRTVVRQADPLGLALFAATLAGLLGFLLSLSRGPLWYLLPATAVAASALLLWERRSEQPFLDVRMLASNRRLRAVYARYAGVNVVYYSVLYGMPIWIETVRGFSPDRAGLLMLPIASMGFLMTPLATRVVQRSGFGRAVLIAAMAVTVGPLLMLTLGPGAAIPAIITVTAVLGVPNVFNNLGLQAALYASIRPAQTGAAAGLFQTFRFVGAILASSVLALTFGRTVSTGDLHVIALVLGALGAVMAASSTRTAWQGRYR